MTSATARIFLKLKFKTSVLPRIGWQFFAENVSASTRTLSTTTSNIIRHTVRLMHCQDPIPHRLAELISEEPVTSRLSFRMASTYCLSSLICWHRIHQTFAAFSSAYFATIFLCETSSLTAWPYQIWRSLDATIRLYCNPWLYLHPHRILLEKFIPRCMFLHHLGLQAFAQSMICHISLFVHC
jgi:hypothetical protein